MRNPCERETTAQVWSGWRGRPTARLTRVHAAGQARVHTTRHAHVHKQTNYKANGGYLEVGWGTQPQHLPPPSCSLLQ